MNGYLPHIEQNALYDKIDWEDTYLNNRNRMYNDAVSTFWCRTPIRRCVWARSTSAVSGTDTAARATVEVAD
ncbi:MAG: hypothetical protein ACOCWL_04150 [Thermoguttaceae bacterium]